MTEARELDTNIDTALGANYYAPWVGPDEGKKNFSMEGEDFHEHQSLSDVEEVEPHQESDAEPWVPTEAEKDAAERLRSLDTVKAAKAAKRPRSPEPRDDDAVPDLAEIFDNYDTPHAVRIAICRAYASYIASLQPKKAKAAPKRKH